MIALKNISKSTNSLSVNMFNYSTVYKSAISLGNIYPQSTLKLTTVSKPSTSQSPDFDGYIPLDQVEITYSRSSGPGGQNVNKVNTKVDVRFHLQTANWLTEKAKTKILEKFGSKLTKEGNLVFRSDITRSQQLNLADCLEKIRKCVRDSLYEHPEHSEVTQEIIRKRIERANRERITRKRMAGALKQEKHVNNVEL